MKALVLSSGGVDSTTALALAVKQFGKENVIALTVSYGQKHDKEVRAAKAVAEWYGVEQLFLDLSLIFRKRSRRRVMPSRWSTETENRSALMCLSGTVCFFLQLPA